MHTCTNWIPYFEECIRGTRTTKIRTDWGAARADMKLSKGNYYYYIYFSTKSCPVYGTWHRYRVLSALPLILNDIVDNNNNGGKSPTVGNFKFIAFNNIIKYNYFVKGNYICGHGKCIEEPFNMQPPTPMRSPPI